MALASPDERHPNITLSLAVRSAALALPCPAFNPSISRRSPMVMLTKHVVPPMPHTAPIGLPAFTRDSFEPPNL
jgi:hypothetical protein